MNDTDIARVGFVPIARPTVTRVKHMPQPTAPHSMRGLRPKRSIKSDAQDPQNIREMKSTPERMSASLGLKPKDSVRMTGK